MSGKATGKEPYRLHISVSTCYCPMHTDTDRQTDRQTDRHVHTYTQHACHICTHILYVHTHMHTNRAFANTCLFR